MAVTDYALGASGVDGISKTANGTTTLVYPVYDGHGNMVCDLSRSGTSFSLNDKRSFDAWSRLRFAPFPSLRSAGCPRLKAHAGYIRSGASTGDPKGRYCASLGHKQDGASGLVYMRARYYEPTSGRFLSQDLDRQGINWQVYCANNPVCASDMSGNDAQIDAGKDLWAVGVLFSLAAVLTSAFGKAPAINAVLALSLIAVAFFSAALGFCIGKAPYSTYYGGSSGSLASESVAIGALGYGVSWLMSDITAMAVAASMVPDDLPGFEAVSCSFTYGLVVAAALLACQNDS